MTIALGPNGVNKDGTLDHVLDDLVDHGEERLGALGRLSRP